MEHVVPVLILKVGTDGTCVPSRSFEFRLLTSTGWLIRLSVGPGGTCVPSPSLEIVALLYCSM